MPSSSPAGLVVVQNRETQFDAPLFGRIAAEHLFRLWVVYTQGRGGSDPELGFAPCWDHLAGARYSSSSLDRPTVARLWQLVDAIERFDPALVILCGYYPRSHLLLALLLRLRGLRIGLRSDNTLQHSPAQGLLAWPRRRLIGAIQRLFHSWHPVGHQAHAYLQQLSGVERPSFLFPYAVDNTWLAQRCARERLQRHQQLAARGWPPDAFVVLAAVKWTPREDPLTVARACVLAAGRCSRLRLVLLGEGPLRPQVEAALQPLGGRAHCPGYVAYGALPHWYALADVFVHPAIHEPWGVSVNEAMACGLPVLAAQGVGAADELLADGRSGLRFGSGDVACLAAQLQWLADAPGLCLSLGAEGRRSVAAWSHAHSIANLQRALAPCSPS
ncbi:MAG: glycosyltransferase family 4 protein [Cyanobacteriota bacterium]|nr:glycosyltransferase family 4 protein [Cyanobacteriota bacterium]